MLAYLRETAGDPDRGSQPKARIHLTGYSRPDDRSNNFNLMRLIAALAVIYAHSFVLTQGEGPGQLGATGDFFYDLTGITSGNLAVAVFFTISGMLVWQSLERSKSLWDFARARILRIFPALIVAVLLTAFVLGPLVTTLDLGDYFRDRQLFTYVALNGTMLLLRIQEGLPGVFTGTPLPGVVNGSLWTLPWELTMYLSLVALALFGLKRSVLVIATIALGSLALFAGWFVTRAPVSATTIIAATFTAYFFSGVLLQRLRARMPLSQTTLALSVGVWCASALMLKAHPALIVVFVPALAYMVLNLALVPKGAVLKFNTLGDFSYGTYIYGCPVQQTLVYLGLAAGPYSLMVTSMVITLALAVASWRWIEKPALALKKKAAVTTITHKVRVSVPLATPAR